MKVLSVFLLLSSAFAQGQGSSSVSIMPAMASMDEPPTVSSQASIVINDAAIENDESDSVIPTDPDTSADVSVVKSESATGEPSDIASVAQEPEESDSAQPTLSHGVPAARETGSYVPLFDFDLAPYNMALEIVAEALEKLADTMEPIDLPLPIVGPGYYLEVMVKAPNNKNPHVQPPYNQINPISIEGGQAPPITEIDIILPGESEVHQTIILPAAGQTRPSASTEDREVPTLLESSTLENASPIAMTDTTEGPLSTPETNGVSQSSSETVSAIDSMTMIDPIPAGTESGSAPLIESVPSASIIEPASSPNVIVGQFSTSGFFEGHLSGVLAFGAPSETFALSESEIPLTSASESPVATETVVSIIGGSAVGTSFTDETSISTEASSDATSFEMPGLVSESSTTEPALESEPISDSGFESDEMFNIDLETVSRSIPEAIDGAYASPVVMQSSSILADMTGEEGPLEGEYSSDSLELDYMPSDSFQDIPISSVPGPSLSLSPSSPPSFTMPEDISAALEDSSSGASSALLATDAFGESEVATGEVPSDAADMTMASVPLPYPPFGGPQQQQQPTISGIDVLPTADLPSAVASEPTSSEDNVIETINIVGASDGNALEASIDAILHSILEEYESESTPKAAVGFALIHARNQVMTGIPE